MVRSATRRIEMRMKLVRQREDRSGVAIADCGKTRRLVHPPHPQHLRNVKDIDMTRILKIFARILKFFAYASVVLAFAAPARAEEVKAGDLVITQAWSRATPGGAKVAGGYLTIENKGSAPDRLIGGSADVADKVEVHEMATNNGVMTMRPLEKGLAIEPGKTVKLAPGGYHLMMMDLKSPLKKGDKLPITLEFEKAGKVQVSLDVEGVGAQGPTASPSSGSKKV
jgi:copper(I)-binding protein